MVFKGCDYMAVSYVNMDNLNEIAASFNAAAAELSNYLGDLSTAAGNVANGWNDDSNSGIFSQKIGEFSAATGSLIAEITNYANFMADCANNKYTPAQQNAINTMGGG